MDGFQLLGRDLDGGLLATIAFFVNEHHTNDEAFDPASSVCLKKSLYEPPKKMRNLH